MIYNWLDELAGWVAHNRYQICIAWVASLLVIYGVPIARVVKKTAKSWHFVFRILFFVIVCAFGYGWVTLFAAKQLSKQLSQLSSYWEIAVVLLAFIFLGCLAERKKQI